MAGVTRVCHGKVESLGRIIQRGSKRRNIERSDSKKWVNPEARQYEEALEIPESGFKMGLKQWPQVTLDSTTVFRVLWLIMSPGSEILPH